MIAGPSTGETPGKDWTVEGNAALVQGNYSGAVFYFDKAIQENRLGRATKIDPQISLAWTNKGYLLANMGRYEETLQSFDAATAHDPESITAWMGRVTVLKILYIDDEAEAAQDKVDALGRAGE